MNTGIAGVWRLALACLLLQGCAIGYNSVLFVTKSNVGIDVDSTPPTAEISIARRENVIEPTFEDGQTPPVLASFRVGIKGILGTFASVSSTFSGGDAAVTMAELFDEKVKRPAKQLAYLCLKKQPSPRLLGQKITFPEPGDVQPFLFGTDTSLGLKLAWSGLTAQYPDTVRLGYNRKELAWAPVFVAKDPECEKTGHPYRVDIPSFLATMDSSATAKGLETTGLDHLQYFATGKAATQLAQQPGIREAMLKRLDPAAAAAAVKLREFRKHQDAQIEAVERIQAAYKEASDNRKEAILQKAKQLTLVGPETTTETFVGDLSDAVDSSKPEITKKLDRLVEFAKESG